MCGIVGMIYADRERAVDPGLIRRMCETVRHRGPNHGGVYLAGPVGLGMRRLSIIDLAGGHQPVFNEDGSKVIVLNGEIYNYRQLRHELVRRGHRFTTRSDTETVLHLFEDMGPGCVDRLRGMFAFAIWDQRERRLLLARDRFGIKPLYVTAGPWGLAFASELKALWVAGLAGGGLDWEALDAYLQLGYIPAPASPFRAVRKLEPGHVLVWTPSAGVRVQAYWDVPVLAAPERSDAVGAVRQCLDQSVAAHLVSDVPVAAFLSGGLDSSAVVSSMTRVGYDTHAFTARYHGSGASAADETRLARELAATCRARLTVVDVDPEGADELEAMVFALDEPHADDSAIPTWLLSRAVADEYRVALTGIGGDELFGGYRRHTGLVVGEAYARLPLGLRRALGFAASLLPEPRSGALGVDRVKRFLAGNGAQPFQRWVEYISRIKDEERSTLYARCLRDAVSGHVVRDRFEELWRRGGEPRGLAAGLYFDYKTFLPDDVLALSDRMSMAHSLEIRVPLVDHELVEQVLPYSAVCPPGARRLKPLLRAALRGRLPAAHFRAPKRGFVGPTCSWLRHELRDMVCDELSGDRMARLGYFDRRVIRGFLDEHLQHRRNREGILWALLCFSVWHRIYVEGSPGSSSSEWMRGWTPFEDAHSDFGARQGLTTVTGGAGQGTP